MKALCLLAATRRAVLGAHVPWQSGWPESCSNTALCLVIPSCAASVPRTFSAFLGHIITSPHVAELPVGQSESHGAQRPADEECLPASSSYEAIMLEERFRDSSISFQMPETGFWIGHSSLCNVWAMLVWLCILGGLSFLLSKQEHCYSSISNYSRARETFIVSLHHGYNSCLFVFWNNIPHISELHVLGEILWLFSCIFLLLKVEIISCLPIEIGKRYL